MSFISSVAELFKGKKQEAPVTPPQQTLEQKQQELDNLQKIMNSPAGRDFRSPQTDTQDRQRIQELQSQIAAMTPSQETETPQPQVTQPQEQQPEITQMPVEQPQQAPATTEEPKVA